jgi:hypothetical protein
MKKISLGTLAVLAAFTTTTAFASIVPPPTDLPEPGTLALLALGVAGIAVARLRGRK